MIHIKFVDVLPSVDELEYSTLYLVPEIEGSYYFKIVGVDRDGTLKTTRSIDPVYKSAEDAIASIPEEQREIGLTVNVASFDENEALTNLTPYWWKLGTNDNNLTPKIGTANSLQEVTDVGAETTHDIKIGQMNISTKASVGGIVPGGPNFGIGYNKFDSITSGVVNYFYGDDSFTKTTTGCFNFAFGSACLKSLTTGWQNIAIGNIALWRLSSGSGNIAFGKDAGAHITTGIQNIYIGTGAGFKSKDATVGEKFKLRIHQHEINYKANGGGGTYTQTPKSYDLIYGEFNNRVVKIGGKLNLRPEHNADTTDLEKHHKIAVADDNNEFSFVDKFALIKAILLNPDFSLTEDEKDKIALNLGLERIA